MVAVDRYGDSHLRNLPLNHAATIFNAIEFIEKRHVLGINAFPEEVSDTKAIMASTALLSGFDAFQSTECSPFDDCRLPFK